MSSKVNRRIDATGSVLCSLCKAWKPAQSFPVKRDQKGEGYSYYCRACESVKSRESFLRRNPDRVPPARQKQRTDGAGRIWCPLCAAHIEPERFRFHERAGKSVPMAYCRSCETAKRQARAVADKRKQPAVTNETRKPARVVSVSVSLPAPKVDAAPRLSRALPPLAADESRKRAITERMCSQCERRQPIANFPLYGVGRRRMTCETCGTKSAAPTMIVEPKSPAHIPRPQPVKPVIYPAGNVAACVWPSMPCIAEKCREMLKELYLAGLAKPMARDFNCTVPADATGIVVALFETKAGADLFNAMARGNGFDRDGMERRAA